MGPFFLFCSKVRFFCLFLITLAIFFLSPSTVYSADISCIDGSKASVMKLDSFKYSDKSFADLEDTASKINFFIQLDGDVESENLSNERSLQKVGEDYFMDEEKLRFQKTRGVVSNGILFYRDKQGTVIKALGYIRKNSAVLGHLLVECVGGPKVVDAAILKNNFLKDEGLYLELENINLHGKFYNLKNEIPDKLRKKIARSNEAAENIAKAVFSVIQQPILAYDPQFMINDSFVVRWIDGDGWSVNTSLQERANWLSDLSDTLTRHINNTKMVFKYLKEIVKDSSLDPKYKELLFCYMNQD